MQLNKLEANRKMSIINMKCEMVQTAKHKFQLTEKCTSDLTSDVRVYSSQGRMFVLSNVQDMRAELKSRQEKCDRTLEYLNQKKEFLLNNLKEQEASLRELVQQRKDANSSK